MRKMLLSGMPTSRASRAWALRCTASPCTGMKFLGCVMASMSLSSSWLPWPETCTRVCDLSKTVQPILESELMIPCTLFSLPGTGVAEMITVSSAVMERLLCSPLAMRARAESGSPWLPVQSTTIFSSGSFSTS